jgi:hypothetical protein
MQLRNARLCLDCEEVHDLDHCPTCASETFAFMTRWVPAPERRARPRTPAEPPSPETLDTYREMLDPGRGSTRWTLVKGGAVGLAVFGLARWMSQRSSERELPEATRREPARRDALPMREDPPRTDG